MTEVCKSNTGDCCYGLVKRVPPVTKALCSSPALGVGVFLRQATGDFSRHKASTNG